MGDGTLRIKFEAYYTTQGGTWELQIKRNGTVVDSVAVAWGGSEENYTSYSRDVSGWTKGDLLQLYYHRTGTGYSAYIRNIYICASERKVLIPHTRIKGNSNYIGYGTS